MQFRVPQKVHNLVQSLTIPPQLPQSYTFKLFYSSRNPISMDVPLLINEHGVFSSHGPLTSSPPLLSPNISNLSKLDDDDVVMFLRNFVNPPKRFA